MISVNSNSLIKLKLEVHSNESSVPNEFNSLNPPEIGGSSRASARKKPEVAEVLLEPFAASVEDDDLFDIVSTN